uniref:Retrotransposon Copia-like N-terminal domain-containing protein n=1 Tax=Lactuca sativa TaxID=4236 RepID=A0A9R1W8W5_LACSA|nr:hypothetical protein LSAT_V11C200066240 [Lactuca sativa]
MGSGFLNAKTTLPPPSSTSWYGENPYKTKTQEGSGGTINNNSPCYLHPSDFPKQLQIGSYEMKNFLFAKNKFEFVDGTIKKP